jgi:hypothetical protein
MEQAGDNRIELEKVLNYYRQSGDEQKRKAAEFLVSYMDYNKFSYEGEIINRYDTLFSFYQSLRENSVCRPISHRPFGNWAKISLLDLAFVIVSCWQRW